MATMKAIRIHNYGGSELMVLEDAPRPEPGANELLIKVRAASVNAFDWKMREGQLRAWGMDPPMPLKLGGDLAGDVVQVGSAVTGFKVGDAVFGLAPPGNGSHAEYVVAPASQVAHKPASVDYETAAAGALAALTAWQGLIDTGGLQAGQTVLIHGAAGGVGSMAVQIAHWRGARVIATATKENAALVRDLGADEVIDYKSARFEDLAHDVDIVLDLVAGDTQDRSWQVLKAGGILITPVWLPPGAAEAAAARGVRAAMLIAQPTTADFQQIAELISAGKLKPVIDTVVPLAEARRAYDRVQTGGKRGKVVLRMGGEDKAPASV